MAHQKINYVLILFLVVGFFSSCKKESKEYTTVIWEVINPVTNAPYTNILVRLYEAKKKSSGIEYSLIYEGQTNNQGRAEYSFKANLNNKYWYSPEINEGSLGVGGIDYAVIKQPSPSVTTVTKDEENIIRYEIVPYAEYYFHIKNINCQGSDDKMRYRSNRLYTRPNDGFSDWSPSETLTSGYYEGCYDNLSNLKTNRSDSIIYEIEVTRNGLTEIITKKFYRGPENVDTIKLYY
jgi:hypothetical protein